MVPFFAERNQRSNLSVDESQNSPNDIIIDTESVDLPEIEHTLLSPTSVTSERTTSPPLRSIESPSLSTTSHISEKRKQQNQPQPALSQVLQEYLGERKQLKLERKPDHLKKFFESMEETVRTFPPLYQIEVKNKIYNLVSEYEYKTLIRNENRPAQEATEISCNLQPRAQTAQTESLKNLHPTTFQPSFQQTFLHQSHWEPSGNLLANTNPDEQLQERSYDYSLNKI